MIPTSATDIAEHLARMPKVELHLHLEGSMQPETLLLLAERNRIDLPFSTPEQVPDWLDYTDFRHFVDVLLTFAGSLKQPEDFTLVIDHLGENLAGQNIRYAEITWTPQIYLPLGLPMQLILDALNEGRRRVRERWSIELRWIPDLVRGLPLPPQGVLDWLCSDATREEGVVALGLAGPERGHSAEPFRKFFQTARRVGLPVNPHAGENAGPESIREALTLLEPSRIGHGVRAVEDPALVALLVKQQVTLEVCPTSNLKLGLYESYAEHPLKKFIEAGCRVTINSDDPVLFQTTLTEEYRHAVFDCGLTLADLEQAVRNALEAAYLEQPDRDLVVKAFAAEFATLHGQPRPSEHRTEEIR